MLKITKRSKFFTLIELIVVIVILGVLAAIVVPNISSFKEEAEETAIRSDARNIQTAVDMFMLESNGDTPTKEKPTLGYPQTIEVYAMKPNFLRDLPKTKRAKFWLDYNNTVWASLVDAPTNVEYDGTSAKLTWNTVDGAELYRIYKSEDSITAAVKNSKRLKLLAELQPSTGDQQGKELPALSKGDYLVTAVDKFEFETAPTKMGSSYSGYQPPDKDYFTVLPEGNGNTTEQGTNAEGGTTIPNSSPESVNQKPIAVITMNPTTNIDINTNVLWSYNSSSDPDGDSIAAAEWKHNGVIVSAPPNKFNAGTHTVELRVQDAKGDWSDSVGKSFSVTAPTVANWDVTGFNHIANWSKRGTTSETFSSSYWRTASSSFGLRYLNYKVNKTTGFTLETKAKVIDGATQYGATAGDNHITLYQDTFTFGVILMNNQVRVINGASQTTVKTANIQNQYHTYRITVKDNLGKIYMDNELIYSTTNIGKDTWYNGWNGNEILLGDNANNSNYSSSMEVEYVNYTNQGAFNY